MEWPTPEVNVFYGGSSGLSATGAELWTRAGAVPGTVKQESFGRTVASGDFDGDGNSDLAVGVPSYDAGTKHDAGAFVILYGSHGGITTAGAQSFTENAFGGAVEPSDGYGSSLTSGDFDGDGHSDLAVGGSEEAAGAVTEAGAVGVLYGSSSGLQATSPPAQLWTQKKAGSANHMFQEWGKTLSAGQLGNGSYDDLVIGAPGNAHASTVTPSFTVLYGTGSGLSATNATEISDTSSNTSQFAVSLAVGDFGGTGHDDVAAGAPNVTVGGHTHAGHVLVFYGSPTGPSIAAETWTANSSGVPGSADDFEAFGASLEAENFGHSQQEDLAVDAPYDTVSGVPSAGSVTILYGAAGGLTSTGSQLVTQNSGDFHGSATKNTYFGSALGGGNYGKGLRSDLAIGSPYASVSGHTHAGAAAIAFGSPSGLTVTGTQYWTQDQPNVPGTAQAVDNFAYALR